jgi:uncharacterized phage-associated protein
VITCIDVADYFLAQAATINAPMTCSKLQKLVYFAQAWHLYLYKTPLFEEDFETWLQGPRLPQLYTTFGASKSKNIELPPWYNPNKAIEKLGDKVQHLEQVDTMYAHLTNDKLDSLVWEEVPFIKAKRENTLSHTYKVQPAIVKKEWMMNYEPDNNQTEEEEKEYKELSVKNSDGVPEGVFNLYFSKQRVVDILETYTFKSVFSFWHLFTYTVLMIATMIVVSCWMQYLAA